MGILTSANRAVGPSGLSKHKKPGFLNMRQRSWGDDRIMQEKPGFLNDTVDRIAHPPGGWEEDDVNSDEQANPDCDVAGLKFR